MEVLFIFLLSYITNVFCDLRGYNGLKCPGYSFRCLNGECIPSTSVCDGAIDCSDRSDETRAICDEFDLPCPPYAFRCGYGACVDKITICNGIQNCADNSDELLPQCFKLSPIVKKCKLYEFQCDSGQCIDVISVCDGIRDCRDGSDETITQCINFGCPSYGFQCSYGGCIDMIKKCDGKEDCKDGSDEDTEICSKNITKQIIITTKKRTKLCRPGSHSRAECLLPKKPDNGNYEVSDCIADGYSSICQKIPGTIVSSNVILEYSCNPGYVLPENIDHSYCKDGSWNPEPPDCLKLCKNRKYSHSLHLKCYYLGHEVNCEQSMRPGTVLNATCKSGYHEDDPSTSFSLTKCLPDGTWDNSLFKCVPHCGFRNTINEVTTTIKKAKEALQSEYPWHAGLFQMEGENLVNICGGTIIHPQAVLTAAHCVYNEVTRSLTDLMKIRVAVGKHWSKWNHEEANEQKFLVKKIFIPERFRGPYGRYEHDIAILHLNRIMMLNPAVMPICRDKLKSFRLDQKPKAVGTVLGWGGTETSEASDKLRVSNFPVLNFHSCLEKVNQSLYVTSDKFCTITNGTGVQKGDSGGGMTFPRFTGGVEQHFIYGIVSLFPTKSEDIAAFTNVTVHMGWIEDVLYRIDMS